jgi:hypothetical protein
MNREHSSDALDAALKGVVSVPRNGGAELPWPPAGLERSWVLTGQGTADKRRAKGSSSRLRRLLVGQAQPRGNEGQWGDFSRAMERRAVTEALTTLPAELREIVRMAYFQGMSNRAVADNLGLSVDGVRRRLRSALRHLESRLRRAGSSLSSTLVAIGSGWLDRAHQGRELVVAAAGTVAATSAVVLLAGSPTMAVAGVPSQRAPAPEFKAVSADGAPTIPLQTPAAVLAEASPGPGVAAAGRRAAGAAPAPGAAIPAPVSLPGPVLPAAPVVQTVVQVTTQVTTQVTSALPPAPPIKLLGR